MKSYACCSIAVGYPISGFLIESRWTTRKNNYRFNCNESKKWINLLEAKASSSWSVENWAIKIRSQWNSYVKFQFQKFQTFFLRSWTIHLLITLEYQCRYEIRKQNHIKSILFLYKNGSNWTEKEECSRSSNSKKWLKQQNILLNGRIGLHFFPILPYSYCVLSPVLIKCIFTFQWYKLAERRCKITPIPHNHHYH